MDNFPSAQHDKLLALKDFYVWTAQKLGFTLNPAHAHLYLEHLYGNMSLSDNVNADVLTVLHTVETHAANFLVPACAEISSLTA